MRVQSRPTGFGDATAGRVPFRPPRSPQLDPVFVMLFGHRPPRRLDRRRYPHLKKTMKKLRLMCDQLAEVLGVSAETFSLELCEGRNACVSREGEISIGIELLEEHEHDNELLVGILGHEMGHQPWTWPSAVPARWSKRKRDAVLREEEAKADRFAGKALADLGLTPEAICRFLAKAAKFETHPPGDYYPAPVRAQMIREAFRRRKRTLKDAERFNPAAALRARELR